MSEIRFTVPAVPVPQPRARATAFNGRARMYEAKTEHPIHAFKASVRMSAASVHTGAPIEGPVRLRATFLLPRPKLPKKAGEQRFPHTKRGDIDNFAKALMDALNGLLWKDDSQVYELCAAKEVCASSETPCVQIVVLHGGIV